VRVIDRLALSSPTAPLRPPERDWAFAVSGSLLGLSGDERTWTSTPLRELVPEWNLEVGEWRRTLANQPHPPRTTTWWRANERGGSARRHARSGCYRAWLNVVIPAASMFTRHVTKHQRIADSSVEVAEVLCVVPNAHRAQTLVQ
jgi:hypothetical protein